VIKVRIEYEDERIPFMRPIMEDEEDFVTIEDVQEELIAIAEDMGYFYEESSEKLGAGFIAITDDVNIIIKYNVDKLLSLNVQVGDFKTDNKYDCTTNSSSIDEISVALQTASMICSEIRRKLK
jgi:hypothetical protein